MDPAVGRRWPTVAQLLEEVYVHTHRIPAEAWREWGASEGFAAPLARRLRDLGLVKPRDLIRRATEMGGWRPLARLDAATRLVEALVRAGGARRGREARRLLTALLDRAAAEPPGQMRAIPESYWSALPAPELPGEEQVSIRGAVLVRVRGRHPAAAPANGSELSPDLAAALAAPATRPLRELFRLVRGYSLALFVFLCIGLILVAAGAVLEAVLLRGMLEVGRE